MRPIQRPSAAILTTCLLAATPGLVGASNADVIAARLDSVDPKRTVVLSRNAGDSFQEVGSGTARFTRIGGDYSGPGANGQFVAYCIELFQSITWGETYDFETRAPENSPVPGEGMGAPRAAALAELYGRFYVPSFATRDEAAAFQIAVWELVHDDGRDLTDGLIQVQDTGLWYGIAQGWLDFLDGQGPRLELLGMTHLLKQDHIIVIPSPAAVSLFACAGIIGLSRRRRTG